MKNKNIIVTGGAGFIGSHLVDALINEGYNLSIIDNLSTGKEENINKKADFHLLDLREREKVFELIKKIKPEIIYHLAAQPSVPISLEKPVYDVEVNLIGGLNILEAGLCTNGIKKFIFSSTGGAIYGEVPDGKKANENWEVKPESVYGASKAHFESCLKSLSNGKIEWTTLRFSNVYGPRQDPYGEAGVIAIFCNSLLEGKPIKINAKKERGDDGCIRDYIFVEDVVSACILSMRIKEGIYNVGTGREKNTKEVYEEINKFINSNSEVIYNVKRKGDLERNVLNIQKLKNFGWKPKYSFKEGIKKTVEWFSLKKEKIGNEYLV